MDQGNTNCIKILPKGNFFKGREKVTLTQYGLFILSLFAILPPLSTVIACTLTPLFMLRWILSLNEAIGIIVWKQV